MCIINVTVLALLSCMLVAMVDLLKVLVVVNLEPCADLAAVMRVVTLQSLKTSLLSQGMVTNDRGEW